MPKVISNEASPRLTITEREAGLTATSSNDGAWKGLRPNITTAPMRSRAAG